MDIILSHDTDELYNIDGTLASFELQSTTELDTMAYAIRQRNGYIPFFDETGSDIWTNGWYDFYLEVDVLKRKATSLVAVVCGNDNDRDIVPDDKNYYRLEEYTSIDFEDVMKQLIAELRKRYTSLDEIEKEVREDEDEN